MVGSGLVCEEPLRKCHRLVSQVRQIASGFGKRRISDLFCQMVQLRRPGPDLLVGRLYTTGGGRFDVLVEGVVMGNHRSHGVAI